MGEEDSERESGKTEGGGLKGIEMTEEAGLHGMGLNLEGVVYVASCINSVAPFAVLYIKI